MKTIKTKRKPMQCFGLLLLACHLSGISSHAALFYPADDSRCEVFRYQLWKTGISESNYGDVVAEGYGWRAYRLDEQSVSKKAIIGFLKFVGDLETETARALWQEISTKGDIYAVWMDTSKRHDPYYSSFRMPFGLIIVDSSQGGTPHVYYHRIPVTWKSLWCGIIKEDDRSTFIQEMYNPEEISILGASQLASQWIPDHVDEALNDNEGKLPPPHLSNIVLGPGGFTPVPRGRSFRSPPPPLPASNE